MLQSISARERNNLQRLFVIIPIKDGLLRNGENGAELINGVAHNDEYFARLTLDVTVFLEKRKKLEADYKQVCIDGQNKQLANSYSDQPKECQILIFAHVVQLELDSLEDFINLEDDDHDDVDNSQDLQPQQLRLQCVLDVLLLHVQQHVVQLE